MVIPFSRDSSGLMFGSFFLHSLIPISQDSIVAYSIQSSSRVPYIINPSCGFIEPGESQQIGILFPEKKVRGHQYDLSMINETTLLIKALPIEEDYFDQIAKSTRAKEEDFNDLQNIPPENMKLIFNYLNKIVLFTMFNISCSLQSENVFRPQISNLQAVDLGLVSEGDEQEIENMEEKQRDNYLSRDRFNH